MTNEREANEGYPADWVRLVLMVSPMGEFHSIGGDPAPGADPHADCELPGMARLRKRFGAALASQAATQEPVAWRVRAYTGIGWTNWRNDGEALARWLSEQREVQYAYAAPLVASTGEQKPDSVHLTPAGDEEVTGRPVLYVASRASVPARPAMWKRLRSQGWPINSTWIDEAGPGETADMGELWARIEGEIRAARGVVLYAEERDFPLKGAFIEAGMAIGMGKRVAVCTDIAFVDTQYKPFGSWMNHALVKRCFSLDEARKWVLAATPASTHAAGERSDDAPEVPRG